MLDSPISESDWARFDAYASRIRDVKVDFTNDLVHPTCRTVYLEISRSRRNIFPSLRVLNVTAWNDGPEFLWSPCLHEVVIKVPRKTRRNDEDISSLRLKKYFDVLGRHSPHLLRLTLDGLYRTTSFPYHSFPSLRFLRTENSYFNLSTLTHHQNLVDLHICIDGTTTFFPVELTSLNALDVSGSISLILRFFECLQAPHLRELKVVFISVYSVQSDLAIDHLTLHRCFASISRYLSVQKFYPRYRLAFGARVSSVGISCIRPLFDWQHLTHLHCSPIISTPSFFASDEDIAAMASAWPEIISLRIWFPTGSPPTPGLLSLEYFSRRCPHLEELTMSVDARQSSSTLSTAMVVSTHGLRHFNPLVSSIDDPDMVARYLDQIFPNIRTIAYTDVRGQSDDTWTRYSQAWKKVDELIRDVIQPARRDQQRQDALTFGSQ